jgi:hypothetical protein
MRRLSPSNITIRHTKSRRAIKLVLYFLVIFALYDGQSFFDFCGMTGRMKNSTVLGFAMNFRKMCEQGRIILLLEFIFVALEKISFRE